MIFCIILRNRTFHPSRRWNENENLKKQENENSNMKNIHAGNSFWKMFFLNNKTGLATKMRTSKQFQYFGVFFFLILTLIIKKESYDKHFFAQKKLKFDDQYALFQL